jgi:hypothetical protein
VRKALQSLTPGGTVGGEGVLLASDVDINGNQWGHLWMQPEPGFSEEEKAGDARPDWEQTTDGGDTTDDDVGTVGTNDDDTHPIS